MPLAGSKGESDEWCFLAAGIRSTALGKAEQEW